MRQHKEAAHETAQIRYGTLQMRSGYHDDAALSPGAPETILLKEISGLDSDSELGLDHYLTMRGTTGGRSVPVQQLARKAGADPPLRLYKAMCTNKTNILFYTCHAACPNPTAGPYLQEMESAMRGRAKLLSLIQGAGRELATHLVPMCRDNKLFIVAAASASHDSRSTGWRGRPGERRRQWQCHNILIYSG